MVQKIPSQISLVYSGILSFRNCNWETKNFVQFEKLGATGERNYFCSSNFRAGGSKNPPRIQETWILLGIHFSIWIL